MVDRFRGFLDRPLDPSAGRAILALASAIFLGFAAVAVFAAGEQGSPVQLSPAKATHGKQARAPAALPSTPPPDVSQPRPRPRRAGKRQDPQDRQGSAAARRAHRALRTHRALQHLPYRRGSLAIDLVGASGGRAILAVSAPTIAAARRGWRAFLQRYRDDGRAYIPRFEGHRGARG